MGKRTRRTGEQLWFRTREQVKKIMYKRTKTEEQVWFIKLRTKQNKTTIKWTLAREQ